MHPIIPSFRGFATDWSVSLSLCLSSTFIKLLSVHARLSANINGNAKSTLGYELSSACRWDLRLNHTSYKHIPQCSETRLSYWCYGPFHVFAASLTSDDQQLFQTMTMSSKLLTKWTRRGTSVFQTTVSVLNEVEHSFNHSAVTWCRIVQTWSTSTKKAFS